MVLVDHLGVEPKSTNYAEIAILRDLPCCLYSFRTLAGLLPSEALVVSRLHYHKHLAEPCSIVASYSLVRTEPLEDG